jgi:hypothetical protein
MIICASKHMANATYESEILVESNSSILNQVDIEEKIPEHNTDELNVCAKAHKYLRYLYDTGSLGELIKFITKRPRSSMNAIVKYNDINILHGILINEASLNLKPVLLKILIVDECISILSELNTRQVSLPKLVVFRIIKNEKTNVMNVLEKFPTFDSWDWFLSAVQMDSVMFVERFRKHPDVSNRLFDDLLTVHELPIVIKILIKCSSVKAYSYLKNDYIIDGRIKDDCVSVMECITENVSLPFLRICLSHMLKKKHFKKRVPIYVSNITEKIAILQSKGIIPDEKGSNEISYAKTDPERLRWAFDMKCILENPTMFSTLWKSYKKMSIKITELRNKLVAVGFPYRKYMISMGVSKPALDLNIYSEPDLKLFPSMCNTYISRLIKNFIMWCQSRR